MLCIAPGVNEKTTGIRSRPGGGLLDPLVRPEVCKNLLCCMDMISSWRRCVLKGRPLLSLFKASIRLNVNERAPGSFVIWSGLYAAIACFMPWLPVVGASATAQVSSRRRISVWASSRRHLTPSHLSLEESSRGLLSRYQYTS